MKNQNFISQEFIVGWLLMLLSLYLTSEGRPLSGILFSSGAIILFTIDLIRKITHLKYAKQIVKKEEEKKNKNKNEQE